MMPESIGEPGSVLLDDDFDAPALAARWSTLCPNGGTLTLADSALRLALPAAGAGQYTDAQIDDCARLPRRRYLWRPPLRLEVRARASHPRSECFNSLRGDLREPTYQPFDSPFLRGAA